jgi:hypothetical protein
LKHRPVLNAGIAFKRHISSVLMISGGFRTDFSYLSSFEEKVLPEFSRKHSYNLDVYHFNSGIGYEFSRGSVILGTDFSYGQDKNLSQVVNITEPVEYIS